MFLENRRVVLLKPTGCFVETDGSLFKNDGSLFIKQRLVFDKTTGHFP